MREVILKGQSGKLYRFLACPPSATWRPVEGVYAFGRALLHHRCHVVFLSRTANLRDRLAGHEGWDEAQRLGATDVLVMIENDRNARIATEEDLLAGLRPIMNESNWAPPPLHNLVSFPKVA